MQTRGYYQEYHGHPVDDLDAVHEGLRAQGKSLVFLAGDSSMDNKVTLRRLEAFADAL